DDQVGQALAGARGLLHKGWEENDRTKLAEALAEANKAAEVAQSGGASEDVRAEADALLKEAAAKAAQAKKNSELEAALLDVSTPRETRQYEQTASGQVVALAELSAEEQ